MSYVRLSDAPPSQHDPGLIDILRRFETPEYLEKLRREEIARRKAREACLLRKHPVSFPLAREAAAVFRRSLGVTDVPSGIHGDKTPYPRWLDDVTPAVDTCGRPYVHVMLSQWMSGGMPRRGVGPDGEVPELPRKVNGIPLVLDVSTCFGRPTCPGERGVPCVDPPEPPRPVTASGLGSLVESVAALPAGFGLKLGVAFGVGVAIGANATRWLLSKK